ncbi:hypothetical protein [Flavobacterium sp.]|uniref:hypothetical protein n=1 Tax=Flavobacterium sp. TaxID=239 RepID=UPI0012118B0E|nr:hypothetical protein [Flavobacterium sp.]RZJ69813.1 MAG: hypothetical protein EOO49_16280 [Flavobacterium sp.]
MKKLLLLLLVVFGTQSCISYYNVTVDADTILYSGQNTESAIIYTIPSGSSVYVKGKKTKKYRRIKYKQYSGYAYNPTYKVPGHYSASPRSASSSGSPSTYSSSSSGKTVNVKGYYRKNGTYVQPHTRSAPRRRK